MIQCASGAFPTLTRHWIKKSGLTFKGLCKEYRCSTTAAIICAVIPQCWANMVKVKPARKLWISVKDGGPALIQNWASAHSLQITSAVLGNCLRRWPNIEPTLYRWIVIAPTSKCQLRRPSPPNFNCKSQPFLIKIKGRLKKKFPFEIFAKMSQMSKFMTVAQH